MKLKGINLYNERSKMVASAVGMLTGAGMACQFLFAMAVDVLGGGPLAQFSAGIFALAGFGIIAYLTDYGWYKTGVNTISMIISKKTYQSLTLISLMAFSLAINSARIYATFFLSYESRHMNADMMVKDAQVENVAAALTLATNATRANVKPMEARLGNIEGQLRNLNKLAEDHFTGPEATASQVYTWKKYKAGNEHSRNQVARWVKEKKSELEAIKKELEEDIHQASKAASVFTPKLGADIQQENTRKVEIEQARMKTASGFFGLVGVGSIIWSVLISIIQALAGDSKEEEVITVKKVGLTVEDLRANEEKIEEKYQRRISEVEAEYLERITKIKAEEAKLAAQFDARLKSGQPDASPITAPKKKRKPRAVDEFSLEVIEGKWYLNHEEKRLTDVKNLARKWKQRVSNYAETNPEASQENQAKWERAVELFHEHDILFEETENDVSFAVTA